MTRYKDSAEEKLQMKGQTEMKHRILELYLNPWIKKLSSASSHLLYVDGFAGSGIYPDGSKGSPLIAIEKADSLLSESDRIGGRIDSFKCIFVENDPTNFERLEESVSEKELEVDDRIDPICRNCRFEDWASEFISDHGEERPPPSLIFIDPFGYGSIPFELISNLFQLRDQSLELLITFMAGKMAQWMTDPDKHEPISTALGTNEWVEQVPPSLDKDERAEKFSAIYQRQLKQKADANFTMPFEMVEESKSQICYYLIHVTNHLEGLKVMKETMFNAGADDEFAYLGPDHTGYADEQLSFAEFGTTDNFDQRVQSFADELHARYSGSELPFESILAETLDQNVFKLTHYRDAFRLLEDSGKLEVEHRPHLPNGNEERGYGRDDLIRFVEMDLSNFASKSTEDKGTE